MKRLLISVLVSLALAPFTGMGTDYINPNGGYVTTPPQIDAANFTNYGTFSIFTPKPFETFNTRNFFNRGTMLGSDGWWFNNNSTVTGKRGLAANFINQNPGVVEAVDPIASGSPCIVSIYGPSYLWIWATNIVTGAGTPVPGASLIVGPNGWMELVGTNINLSRSGLEVVPVWGEPLGSGDYTTNSFYPDVAVYDEYWAQASFSDTFRLNTAALWDGFIASAPGVPRPPAQPTAAPGFYLLYPDADSYINVLPRASLTVTVTNQDQSTSTVTFPTNITKGAVFVSAPPNFSVQLGFSGPANNYFDTIGVLLSVQLSNQVTARPETAYIYFEDELASRITEPARSARGLIGNIVGCPPTGARPANYYVDRLPWFPGLSGNNGYPDADFFVASGAALLNTNILSDSVTNAVVGSGDYAAYSPLLDNVVSRPPAVPGGTVTNLPGRIRIYADSLDMSKTRLRAEGEIMIQTRHLISSTNAVVDCENLSFNLSSTNGSLNVQSLSKASVERLRGPLYAWSAVWSNRAVVVVENYTLTNSVDTNGVTNVVAVLSPLTNTVTMGLHTLMLDATALTTVLPVTVYDLVTHSTNVVVSDNVSVIQSLLIDGQSFTLNGSITLPGVYPANPLTGLAPPATALQDWTYANAPNLLYFTNHGTLTIPNQAHFGDDGPRAYSAFVNTGTISAASIQLNSSYFENGGTLTTAGPLFMQGGSGKLQNGNSSSGGDVQLYCGSLKLNNYQLATRLGAIVFNVTNALFDSGSTAGNTLTCSDGFQLAIKPPSGDLLGTTFQTTAPRFAEVDPYWAGADRGPSALGYSNNVAVGKLVLAPQGSISNYPPLFFFAGTGAQNALYADLLDLSALGANYQNLLMIDPSLVIYFAAAKVGFTPPPNAYGIPQEPEEYLDGQFDGHLCWVRDFAGPNSSVDVVINGQTVKVNRALRNSKIIDSDGDGLPNYYDSTPFGGLSLAISLVQTNPPPSKFLAQTNQPSSEVLRLSWQAAPYTVYQVEFTTNMPPTNWRQLLKFTNNVPTNRLVTIWDTNAPAGAVRRFYRVGHSP